MSVRAELLARVLAALGLSALATRVRAKDRARAKRRDRA
jgi:hypothetical protein